MKMATMLAAWAVMVPGHGDRPRPGPMHLDTARYGVLEYLRHEKGVRVPWCRRYDPLWVNGSVTCRAFMIAGSTDTGAPVTFDTWIEVKRRRGRLVCYMPLFSDRWQRCYPRR